MNLHLLNRLNVQINYLDNVPKLCAEFQCDKDVLEQIETVVRFLDPTPAERQYLWTTWTQENDKNYQWTWSYFYWLAIEHVKRFKRMHESAKNHLKRLKETPPGIPACEHSNDAPFPLPLTIPVMYRTRGCVYGNRAALIAEKGSTATWNYSATPYWWPSDHDIYQTYAIWYLKEC